MMANPEMSGAQERFLGAVPPQGAAPEDGDAPATVRAAAELRVGSGDGDDGAAVLVGAAGVGETSRVSGTAGAGDVGRASGAVGAAGVGEASGVSGAAGASGTDADPVGTLPAKSVAPAGDLSAQTSNPGGRTTVSEPADPPFENFAEVSEPSELAGAPAPRGLPLLARVLFADLGVAVVAMIALIVIEVQRINETGMHLRRQAYVEDLVVLFAVAAVFGLVAFFLARAGRTSVAIVQAVATLLVLGVAITSAATGSPKPITVEQDH